MLGLTPVHRPVVRALFRGDVHTDPSRRSFLPADLDVADGVYVVRPLNHAGHGLFNAAAASAFVVVPEGVGRCEDGRTVEVVVLERRHA
jgi:molybdopterin biosynthesis enzyme